MNVLLAGCAAIVLMAVGVPAIAAVAKTGSSADDRFKALYTSEWKWREDQFAGGEDDVKEIVDHLVKVDPATQEMRLQHWEKTLKDLAAIPRDRLSAANQVNYDVYKPQLEVMIAEQKFRGYEMPANSDTTFWTDLGYTARQDFRSEKDYEHWIAQMRDVPRYFHEQIAEMRAGLKRGFTPPQVTLAGRDASIRNVVDAKPEDSLFYTPFKTMPGIAPDAQAKLRAEAVQVIQGTVQPTYAELLKFWNEEYVPGARKTLAAEALPDGKAYYRQ